jgi:hypothetical protein
MVVAQLGESLPDEVAVISVDRDIEVVVRTALGPR